MWQKLHNTQPMQLDKETHEKKKSKQAVFGLECRAVIVFVLNWINQGWTLDLSMSSGSKRLA